ncbi:uncharacterized protein Z518_10322 [Rhinocladiella mackenziei CBS 650.93]|uniref:NAD(P)-binding domain-containing protein n=1 Tax=Rhinocladiella mackenziei CBS 650.93 TaxID=1442369 RepID=A0A0D2I326_9EURO|nr:uncharacterized protein Z518_10322 [Rhinocladiella mackenziei CBS 650.93]KIX00184.1 hypothetical protein Z518_10322 [Rhinocladiella mackenziei CBS 650.93]
MVHLILTGATGLVGSAVLSHILSLPASSTPTITRLSILSRNTKIPLLSLTPPPGTPSVNKHTRIEVIEHKDFASYPPELLDKLKGADACIWTLGVSQNDVSKDQFARITRDFALEAAKAFSSLRDHSAKSDGDKKTTSTAPSPSDSGSSSDAKKFKFIYVSSEGATTAPKPWTPLYCRVKGETERALLALSKQNSFKDCLAVYSVRPGAVDGHNEPWLWKGILAEKRSAFQKFYLPTLMVPIRAVGGTLHTPTEELGRVLVEMAVRESREAYALGPGVEKEGEGRTLGNTAVKRLGREEEGR